MRRLALLFAGLAVSPMYAQQVQVSPANRTIAVTATEQAERRADVAVVHVGYQLYAATSEQVTEDAGKRSKAVTDALKQAGLPADAVESDAQGTGPNPEFQNNGLPPEEQVRRRFQAQQSWTVRVPAEASSKALAAAVAAGANQSGAINWSVADETTLSAEAAGKALKHAQAIAEQMAAGLNAKLGPLVYASNEAQQAGLPLSGRTFGPAIVVAKPAAQTVTLVINSQLVRRSATVYAVFSLQ